MTSRQLRIEENTAGADVLAGATQPFEYEITGLIAEGDFGIVYLAFDPSSRERIAIREYLPTNLAARSTESPAVIVKSARHVDLYQSGLRSFINEARTLERFDHPAIVKVLRWWEGNGTAYMAMPYYEGPTLAKWLADLGEVPDEKQLLELLHPLLDGLAAMHAVRCLHRDIAPEKILVTPNGPLLLDLGAARRVIGNVVQTPNAARQRGFAPIEQYGDAPSMKQGPWTDLYALAAVVYAAITGKRPMAAVERLMDDRLVLVSELAQGRYSVPFLAAIDAALALRPPDRPQSANAFWAQLNGHESEAISETAGASTEAVETYPTLPAALEPLEEYARPLAVETRLDLSAMDPLWSTGAALSGTSVGTHRLRFRTRYFVIAAICVVLAAAVIVGANFQALKSTQMQEAVPRPRAAVSPARPAVAAEPEALALPEPMVISPTASTLSGRAKAAVPIATVRSVAISRSKCSELLQSASLGPLRPGDAALLESECRP